MIGQTHYRRPADGTWSGFDPAENPALVEGRDRFDVRRRGEEVGMPSENWPPMTSQFCPTPLSIRRPFGGY